MYMYMSDYITCSLYLFNQVLIISREVYIELNIGSSLATGEEPASYGFHDI